MNLSFGYWQIPVEENSKSKTAFISKQGLFEFNSMPFGVCNGPATFQRAMDTILTEYRHQFILVYLDDINIHSQTFEEHLEHLQKVFEKLHKVGLKLNPEKCNLFWNKLPFLGYIITAEGISSDPSTVERVKNFFQPRTVKQLKSFLELAGYYRKFIKGFSQIASPLFKLLRNNITFVWTQEQEKAFQELKHKLTSAPILIYPDFTRKFYLYTDASDNGLGAVLAQHDADGKERVIAYASVTLKPSEKNYSTTEKEALAVVWAVRQFRHYLLGTLFEVTTDHNALRWLFHKQSNPGPRIARWIMEMTEYNFIVTYRSGKVNQNADALSRLN